MPGLLWWTAVGRTFASSSFRLPWPAARFPPTRPVSIEPGPSGRLPTDRVTGPEPWRCAMLGRRRPGSCPVPLQSA